MAIVWGGSAEVILTAARTARREQDRTPGAHPGRCGETLHSGIFY